MFGDYATMHIAAKARVIFMNNSAEYLGGAVSIEDGMITVGIESCITFTYNNALGGGALRLINSTIHVNTNGMEFYNNKAMKFGGAIVLFYGTIIINTNKSLKFIMNSAQVEGGAIYQ